MQKINVEKLTTLTGHKDCVYTLEKTQVDHIFFSGAGDGMVVYWDLKNPENGQLIAKLPNSVYGLHFMEEDNQLVVGHNYDGIHFIDWESKKETGSVNITKSAIFDITSYQGLIFVATGSGEVIVVDKAQRVVIQRLKHSEKSARCLAINPVNKELVVGYSDHKVRVFSLEDSEMPLKHTLDGHENSVFTICYSPDYSLLLTAGRDAHLKAWDVKAGYIMVNDVVAHMYAINHVEYSPDGKHFVTCSMDKAIKVWDAQELKLLKVIDKSRHAGHGTSVNKLLWATYQSQLVSASDDRTISVWDIQF